MNLNIYTNEYAISKTGLDYIDVSPLDYWWRFLNPEREPFVKSKETIFDEALRSAILTPSVFSRIYVKQPSINKRTNFGKSEFSALSATIESNGQILVSGDDYDKIISIRDAVMAHPTTKLLFSEGKPGEPTRFEEQNSGAIVKFCPHWMHSDSLIVHLASTKDAGSDNFAKDAWNLKYHKRAALQIDGTGVHGFVFVMVEKEPPHKLQIHTLNERSIDLGRATYVKNCHTYVECLKTGRWQGLPEKIQPVSLPEWAFKNY